MLEKDEENQEKRKIKAINAILKNYEDLGLIMAGDVQKSKNSNKDCKYYKSSDFVIYQNKESNFE